ncbi:hypothetical protein VRK_11910 [Vibrio sp. MEBiC08052]|nr:hypothetical protein VRK_11910 [Vibrio sp. MEBiC08052]
MKTPPSPPGQWVKNDTSLNNHTFTQGWSRSGKNGDKN